MGKGAVFSKGKIKAIEAYDEYYDCVLCPENQVLKYTLYSSTRVILIGMASRAEKSTVFVNSILQK